jgi:hypothetical protein
MYDLPPKSPKIASLLSGIFGDHIEKVYAIVALLSYDPFAYAVVKQY